MRLFRPVGLFELRRIAESEFKVFPPGREHELFAPSIDLEHTRQVARDWIATHERTGHLGFVTQFEINAAFMAQFPIQESGATCHRELWLPSEGEAEFNAQIQGTIAVIETFVGARFTGDLSEVAGLALDLLGHVNY